ncbi:hypothetical protein KCV06_g74, partial [Aureobasidium melanogenum]
MSLPTPDVLLRHSSPHLLTVWRDILSSFSRTAMSSMQALSTEVATDVFMIGHAISHGSRVVLFSSRQAERGIVSR